MMLATLLLIAVVMFLAYANGANDNFKGVATLYGDGTLSYGQALSLATVAQVAGSIFSVVFAAALVKAFSGKGLVGAEISGTTDFLLAVGFGGGVTVILATYIGFPISTTHALTGALAGTALLANDGRLDLAMIGSSFFLPLLISPVLAVLTAAPLYRVYLWLSKNTAITPESCVCFLASRPSGSLAVANCAGATHAHPWQRRLMRVASIDECQKEDFDGGLIAIEAGKILTALHLISAFALCFARGLNDTPKIVGLLFAAQALNTDYSLTAVAAAMAIGGILQSRKVAERMSKDVTTLNEPQALIANLVSSFYVIGASRLGLPVSTTHISVSSISGVGLVDGSAHLPVIRNIILSWVLTLPIAALIGMSTYATLQNVGV